VCVRSDCYPCSYQWTNKAAQHAWFEKAPGSPVSVAVENFTYASVMQDIATEIAKMLSVA